MGKKIVIVGGVAGGATAAARLRRLDEFAEIIIFERGPHVSFANCGLPYYIGGVIEKKNSLLVQTPDSMRRRYNIDVRVKSEVRRIFPAKKQVEVLDLSTGAVYLENYDYLVLSPGANPVVPPIPGINLSNVFTVKNVPDGEKIREYIEKTAPAAAVVIGGGFIGLEMAEVLHGRGIRTTVVEASEQVLGVLDQEMAAIVHRYLREQGVDLRLSDRAVSIEGTDRAERVVLESGGEIPADMVILGIGVKPEVWLAREAGLAIGPAGGIRVDEYMRTSDPFIYAVGDAVQVRDFVTGGDTLVPLAGPANRQGRLVADNIAGTPVRYKGIQGTAIIKIIKLVAAVTGGNEKSLRKTGVKFLTCHLHPQSHAAYYPGGSQMSLKLLFTPDEGRVLGAQAVGYEGVDKCIDVIATAMRAGMTVFDLQDLELAYAPPFSSAKHPVNMAGYAAANVIQKYVETVDWNRAGEMVSEGALLIDVRTPKEVSSGAVEGSVNIPLDDLRNRLDEIPGEREVLAYCQVGLRSYIANRILRQRGFKVKNVSGGFNTYKFLERK